MLWIKLHSVRLPSSHLFPLHGCLHEQTKVSFSWSKIQEPLFRHPFTRQPCRKRKNKYPTDMILQPRHLAFYLSESLFSQRSITYRKEKRKSFWGLSHVNSRSERCSFVSTIGNTVQRLILHNPNPNQPFE